MSTLTRLVINILLRQLDALRMLSWIKVMVVMHMLDMVLLDAFTWLYECALFLISTMIGAFFVLAPALNHCKTYLQKNKTEWIPRTIARNQDPRECAPDAEGIFSRISVKKQQLVHVDEIFFPFLCRNIAFCSRFSLKTIFDPYIYTATEVKQAELKVGVKQDFWWCFGSPWMALDSV
jgi:hypothetical protein